MEPKYLPHGWRVEHTIERSFGEHSKFNKIYLEEQRLLAEQQEERKE
jgi:hypothetical protein